MEFASPPPPPPSSWEPEAAGAVPPPGRRGLPHALLVGGLVFGMALGGAGIAFAAGSGNGTGSGAGSGGTAPATPNGTSHPSNGRHARAMGGPFGALGHLGIGGRVLYGQATIETPSGTTKTLDFQLGTVSTVSSDSITVQSGTGSVHTQTYTVEPSTVVDSQAGGITSVKSGDKVIVVAVENGGGNPTAMDIRDQTQMRNSRQGFGFGAPPAAGPAGSAGSAGYATGPTGSEIQ